MPTRTSRNIGDLRVLPSEMLENAAALVTSMPDSQMDDDFHNRVERAGRAQERAARDVLTGTTAVDRDRLARVWIAGEPETRRPGIGFGSVSHGPSPRAARIRRRASPEAIGAKYAGRRDH